MKIGLEKSMRDDAKSNLGTYGSLPPASPADSVKGKPMQAFELTGMQTFGLILLSSCLASTMALCISASKVGGTERYIFVTVTFLSECTKGTVALIAYYATRGSSSDKESICGLLFSVEGLYYSVPAFLYALDNNLGFIILRFIDPATQSLLWNIKIVQTALLFRFVLGRRLTFLRWLCVSLLFCGIVGSQASRITRHVQGNLEPWEAVGSYEIGVGLVVVGTSITSFAGIYTEYVLKRHQETDFFKQQVLLYIYGALFNAILLFGKYREQLNREGFFGGYDAYAVWVIVIMAGNGVATATIFKYLDNIMNVYTQAGTMLITATVSTVIGTFVPNVGFVCGTLVCLVSMYIYNCPLELLLSGSTAEYYEEIGVITSSRVTNTSDSRTLISNRDVNGATTEETGAIMEEDSDVDGRLERGADGRCRYRITRISVQQEHSS
jgi:UDP-galactose transporter